MGLAEHVVFQVGCSKSKTRFFLSSSLSGFVPLLVAVVALRDPGWNRPRPELSKSTDLRRAYDLKLLLEISGEAIKLAREAFGSVYKGTLKDGTNVAVKVLSSSSNQGAKEFLSEITAISDIVHENLVKLHGVCIEGNRRMLVYNYLENNSLAQTLLGTNNSNIQFNWRTRYKICIGIARGLAFLHEEIVPHIVHRDIKASNILLDKDLTPKISDFGLAKLLPPNATHVSTRVAGTIGYLAPEYALRGQVNRKSDVYSFEFFYWR
ncbi:hypothetical protein HPP92_009428 [Vanilla planifolia]|uniref:non-specific serine/threonine protein kinase n=1 Tax=Vanilla planifolia TaxID=51239 RepID=A0A835V2U8_VANPL|nr:hypothetical protein HPP92_009428 [Vanilla planifolia]